MDDAHALTTALSKTHVAAGATMAECDGWLMPHHYRDVDAEARDLRQRAGVFDSSHLGRIRIRGDGALDLLEHACTADVAHQEDNTARLTAMCDEPGSVVDVGFLVRLESFWVFTSNAAARPAVLSHLQTLADDFGAKVDDQTFKTSMLTVAGPAAPAVLDGVLPEKVSALRRGEVRMGTLLLGRYVAMRTGSTGLWSLQVMLPNMLVSQAWRFITHKAGDNSLPPIGTAAQEVLRRQAGVIGPAELAAAGNVLAAGLEGLVDFAHDFLGRDALLKLRATDEVA